MNFFGTPSETSENGQKQPVLGSFGVCTALFNTESRHNGPNSGQQETQTMSISLPKSIESAFKKATDNKESLATLARYLRTEPVLNALIDHRKSFCEVNEKEYRNTLEMMLSFYHPGDSVGVNDLAKNASKALDELFKDRRISQTAIRDSFIPMLREIGVIEGDGRLTWAYLDTPNAFSQAMIKAQRVYHAYMATTEHEAKLKNALRDASAQRQLEAVILDSRKLQEDIGHQLDFLKREDRKHREQAIELGIAYSQIKEDAMRKRKASKFNLKSVAFPAVLVAIVGFGYVMAPSQPASDLPEEAYQASPVTYDAAPVMAARNPMAEQLGLSADEYQWRQRYIELYKANNGGGSEAMETELFDLAAEYMIGRMAMERIVKTITPAEVN